MSAFRCRKDWFGYCTTEPEWEVKPTEIEHTDYNNKLVGKDLIGGTCKLDYHTCGRYKAFTEVVKPNNVIPKAVEKPTETKKPVAKVEPRQSSFA